MNNKKGSNLNNGMFPFQSKTPKGTDPTTDFARALQAANNAEGAAPEAVGLPAIFPGTREEVEDCIREEVPPPKRKSTPSLVETSAKDFRARYQRFDIADPDDVAELEKINNHIMQDGWLPGREEWIHTRDGGTYVVLKWLERVTPLKKKATPEKDETDATLESLGIGRS